MNANKLIKIRICNSIIIVCDVYYDEKTTTIRYQLSTKGSKEQPNQMCKVTVFFFFYNLIYYLYAAVTSPT